MLSPGAQIALALSGLALCFGGGIFAILMAIAIPNFMEARERSISNRNQAWLDEAVEKLNATGTDDWGTGVLPLRAQYEQAYAKLVEINGYELASVDSAEEFAVRCELMQVFVNATAEFEVALTGYQEALRRNLAARGLEPEAIDVLLEEKAMADACALMQSAGRLRAIELQHHKLLLELWRLGQKHWGTWKVDPETGAWFPAGESVADELDEAYFDYTTDTDTYEDRFNAEAAKFDVIQARIDARSEESE